ncbi:hypothetical protein BDY21DRAFT_16320 [Lineolata rhizophorae]|uniref:Uncharacterized protein n=1 Tax=Lineolata rhizophorae TaxID=578093 RepID=A0A6A6P1T1_9PEZI|nr:hypothetical protein BDY21DRAFT_16320 [Lineolata rhizophorae]
MRTKYLVAIITLSCHGLVFQPVSSLSSRKGRLLQTGGERASLVSGMLNLESYWLGEMKKYFCTIRDMLSFFPSRVHVVCILGPYDLTDGVEVEL